MIVDHSALFRAGVFHILAGSRFRVRAGCASLQDLSENAFGGDQCVALISFVKNPGPLLAEVSSLRARHSGLRVIMFTERFDPEELLTAIEAGADGYLLKNEISPDALLQSLELVMLGGVVVPQGFTRLLKGRVHLQLDTLPIVEEEPETMCEGGPTQAAATAALTDDLGRLSNREQMILKQLMQGASNKLIARELNISEATVKVHVKNLLRKIRVNNRTQAAMWAIDNLPPSDR